MAAVSKRMRLVEAFILPKTRPPEKIGHKALARCLSDIAAMAGTPTAALVTIALPAKFDVKFIEAIYAGMSALAQKHGVAIVGGENDDESGAYFDFHCRCSVFVARGKAVLRSGAKAGDAIFCDG